MQIAIWPLALLLAAAVAACPLMACPIVGATPGAGDDCCPKSTQSSSHCPRQTPSDCPYLVVEKSLLSKSAQAMPVVVACAVAFAELIPPSLVISPAPHAGISRDLSDMYLQIRVLRI